MSRERAIVAGLVIIFISTLHMIGSIELYQMFLRLQQHNANGKDGS